MNGEGLGEELKRETRVLEFGDDGGDAAHEFALGAKILLRAKCRADPSLERVEVARVADDVEVAGGDVNGKRESTREGGRKIAQGFVDAAGLNRAVRLLLSRRAAFEIGEVAPVWVHRAYYTRESTRVASRAVMGRG